VLPTTRGSPYTAPPSFFDQAGFSGVPGGWPVWPVRVGVRWYVDQGVKWPTVLGDEDEDGDAGELVVAVSRCTWEVGREAAGDADEQAAASTQQKGTTTETMRRIGPVCPRAPLPSPARRVSTRRV
jgi:hypothetical protein